MLPIITNPENLTMSSREIAELTNKKHSHVKRDLEKMCVEINRPNVESSAYEHRGNTYYQYHLDKELTLCLIAGYSANVRMTIIRRWQELESQPKEDPIVLLAQKVLQQDAQIKQLEMTKAQINDKRTATIMGRLGHAAKKISKLESQLQDTGDYRSLMAAGLPQRVDTEFKSNVQTWRILKKISDEIGRDIRKVDDPRYGNVNTYHVDVIENFQSEYL